MTHLSRPIFTFSKYKHNITNPSKCPTYSARYCLWFPKFPVKRCAKVGSQATKDLQREYNITA